MFNTETELVESFIQSQKKENKIHIKEVVTNFGIPDIIEIKINNRVLNQRKQLQGLQIERMDTYIMSFLYGKGWVKRDTIMFFMNIGKSEINKSIDRLLSRELITMKENTYIKLKRKSDILYISSIKAYEAKLTNWKYVVEQAERHLWFTNESSIVLPRLSTTVLEKATTLSRECGLGIVAVDENKVNFLSKPSKASIKNTPLLWQLNEGLLDGRYIFDRYDEDI